MTDQKINKKENLPDNYELTDLGLFFSGTYISSPIKVIAKQRDINSRNWGKLIELTDASGITKRWPIPMEMLAGNGDAVISELLNLGAIILDKKRFINYLQLANPDVTVLCVTKIGWHYINGKRVFARPDMTIGGELLSEEIIFQSDNIFPYFRLSGTLDEWQTNISKYCIGNSRLILVVSCAFAAMLLDIVNEGSGGINLFGKSSSGKSTAQKAAVSVYGAPDYGSQWLATRNGLEGGAESRNDCLKSLDETGHAEPEELGKAIYMIASGSGKVRMTSETRLQDIKKWRTLVLSSSECPLNQYISEGRHQATAGQAVRLIDIDANTGKHGVFENLHEFNSGHEFSVYLEGACKQFYGTASIEFLKQVIQFENNIKRDFKEFQNRFFNKNVPNDADGQIKRVAKRLALIAFAGELASSFGITGWEKDDAVRAIQEVLKIWIDQRGGLNSYESHSILKQVKKFLEANGDSRFTDWDNPGDSKTINRAGFKRRHQNEDNLNVYWFYVFPETFKEICKGQSKEVVIATLKNTGWIEIDGEGKSSKAISLPNMPRKTRCYVFNDLMWNWEG